MFCIDFRIFLRTRFSFKFIDPAFEKLPVLKISNYFLHIERKNHFRPRIQKFVFKPANKSKEKELLHFSLVESLQNCKTVEEQINVFHSSAKLSDENINSRFSICQDLEKILQSSFPSCFIHLIGSSIHGLGFRGCDVDLTVQFPNEIVNEKSCTENVLLSDELETKGPISKAFSPKYRLRTIKQILESLKCYESLTVISGHCPILTFTVQNLPCDLSINNSSAFHSTNLMLLCGKLDERVAPLMQIIIYWAKHCRLIGGPVRFKTYAFFLMVLYFLQTRTPPVLPSVETMFEKTDFLKNLDNWSYDVIAYLNQFEKSSNTQTVEELLRDFFFFYRSFDFSQIICPINSNSIDKKSLAAKIGCSSSFAINSICIQDPLDPVLNVTTAVNWNHCKRFLKCLISICEKYQNSKYWTPESQNWGLASIIFNNMK